MVDQNDVDELEDVFDKPVEIREPIGDGPKYLMVSIDNTEPAPEKYREALKRGYAVEYVRNNGDRIDFRPIVTETRTETIEVERDVTTFADA